MVVGYVNKSTHMQMMHAGNNRLILPAVCCNSTYDKHNSTYDKRLVHQTVIPLGVCTTSFAHIFRHQRF